jgi:hypothetical protein
MTMDAVFATEKRALVRSDPSSLLIAPRGDLSQRI